MTRTQLIRLRDLASQAAAILIPLCDHLGRDSHGGKMRDAIDRLEEAKRKLVEAGRMAGGKGE